MSGRRVLLSVPYFRCAASLLIALLFAGVAPRRAHAQSPLVRYRVEQVLRLETTQNQRGPATLQATPLTTTVEGRVRFVLEQGLQDAAVGDGYWRFAKVEIEGPRSEPPEAADAGVQRALALGLDWMKQLDGQEVSGDWENIPVLPLGEASPPWLTTWLRWAQTGRFAGLEGSPIRFPSHAGAGREPQAKYDLAWLRSEFRQQPCHVQQARWVLPVVSSAESVTKELAAQGVRGRTHFAAQSLEWVTQSDPTLVYAERSGVRETFWDMNGVEAPDLRELIFRLRLSVQVRVERLP